MLYIELVWRRLTATIVGFRSRSDIDKLGIVGRQGQRGHFIQAVLYLKEILKKC